MKISLVTCQELPAGTSDDRLFFDFLISQGHHVEIKEWTDPSVEWSAFDKVIIRSTWDYHYSLPIFLGWAKKVSKQTKLINSFEIVLWNSSKEYLLDLWRQGISIVPTFLFDDVGSAVEGARKLFETHESIVAKPTVSATSHLTFKLTSTDCLDKSFAEILTKGSILLQPFLESVADGEVSLIYFNTPAKNANVGGPRFSHAVIKKPVVSEFRVQHEFGGTVESFTPTMELIDFGFTTLNRVKFDWTYARVDVMNWKSEPLIGELEMIEPQLFFKFSTKASILLESIL